MNYTIYKKIAYSCALLTLAIALFYLFWWHSPLQNRSDPYTISYPDCFAFLLISLGSFTIYRSSFANKAIGTALCLLSLLHYTYLIFFQDSLLDQFLFFSFQSTRTNLLGYLLLSIFFLIWNRKQTKPWQYLYGFFSTLTCLGTALIGITSYLLDFHGISNLNLFAMITLIISSLGIACSIVYFALSNHIYLHKWIPFLTGTILLIFVIFLSFILYPDMPFAQKVPNLVLGYAFFGGLAFSAFASALTYFLILSKQQIMHIRQITNQLELARQKEAFTLEAAHTGTWQWDTKEDLISCNTTTEQLFGLKPGAFPKTITEFLPLVYSKDRDVVKSSLEYSAQTKKPYEITYRIRFPDQSIHFIYANGNWQIDKEHSSGSLFGTVIDVTPSKQAEQVLKLSERATTLLNKATSLKEFCRGLSLCLNDLFDWDSLALWVKSPVEETYLCIDYESTISTASSSIDNLNRQHPIIQKLLYHMQPFSAENKAIDAQYFSSLHIDATKALFIPIIENDSLQGVVGLFTQALMENLIEPLFSHGLTLLAMKISYFLHKMQIQSSLEEASKIIEALPSPIYSLAANGTIHSWNTAAERHFGWLAKEVIGKHIETIFPNIASEELGFVKQVIEKDKELSQIESTRKTKENKLLWIHASYSPFVDRDGNKKAVVILSDITEERLAKKELALAEEKFHAFVKNTEEWVWETDCKGIFTYSNPAVENILGYSPEQIIGQSMFVFLSEEKKEIQKKIEQHMMENQGWSKWVFLWKDILDKERILESTALPIISDTKEIKGFRGANLDITKKVHLEKSRNEFIAIIGHEIKTPLTSIYGALGLLSAEPHLPPKTQELLAIATRNSHLLVQLVQDIIDIEKIELGKLTFHLKILPLDPIISEAISSAKVLANKKHISILEDIHTPEVYVSVDPERTSQVLSNLFSNAIKFSSFGGEIFVSTQIQTDRIRCSIQDKGKGIPKEFQPKIFERFEQVYFPLSPEQKGTGLGLNISKSLIEQMGGSIGFTSELGAGSTFYFEFPIISKEKL